jgi:hypothetical protein
LFCGRSAGGKKRSHEGSDEEGAGSETSKKRRVEDETLEEAVAEIIALIEDTKKMVGPQSMFPEHAPRSESTLCTTELSQKECWGSVSYVGADPDPRIRISD